ncbi:hypothetical protein FHR24_003034 [Wenyingzhuangia heitensis]|uniref:Uncharacterized protein n=1 Tax=Wenyingzhuangia heitensis TaxID=1487859 RepID=A0ABX0UCI4_9FLAO|nr:hypothetical protein [Wenyingzhuangia heitensis]
MKGGKKALWYDYTLPEVLLDKATNYIFNNL